jgi:hypothetical protein
VRKQAKMYRSALAAALELHFLEKAAMFARLSCNKDLVKI